ncbi:MAG: type II CRISPR-associated endonuclease Cas1 [Pseudomonadota bacterium]
MERIIDIATDGQHLSTYRGFLKVERDGEEVGRIALDDIAAVIVHAHGVTYSNNLLVALAEHNAVLVACGRNHAPVACLLPLSGHHIQGARMRAQWRAPAPVVKRAWQQIVRAKILAQAANLAAIQAPSGGVAAFAARVRSGDPDNVEAQAARRYWPLMMGRDFRRDRGAAGINALLNYGYTVLRACATRAVVAAGLHPTIGIAHANRANAFALADDVMEPFRPLVDFTAKILFQQGETDVTARAKAALAQLMVFDIETERGVSPVFACLGRLAGSLAHAFEAKGAPKLDLPSPASALHLAALGQAIKAQP